MLSFAPDGLIAADPGNIKKTHCMCRAKLSQHFAYDRMRGRFRVVRNETDVHLIATRPRAHLRPPKGPRARQTRLYCGQMALTPSAEGPAARDSPAPAHRGRRCWHTSGGQPRS